MSWSRIGTVNATNGSVVVQGVGTSWLTDQLTRAGDMLLLGGVEYEVAASPTTDTALTLVTPYAGATAVNLTYAIVHTGLLPSELARDLAALQKKYLAAMSVLYEGAIVGSGTWRDGTAAPNNAVGIDRDRYINTITGDVFLRRFGTYMQIGNIKGIKGDTPPMVFDLSAYVTGRPYPNMALLRVPVARACSFPWGFAGSHAYSGVAAMEQTDFGIYRNGTLVGTMRFAAGSSTASFDAPLQTHLLEGDRIEVRAPSEPDLMLADISFVLRGSR